MSRTQRAAVEPSQLNRDDLGILDSRLELVHQVLFTIGNDPLSIHTADGLFFGLSRVVQSVQEDIARLQRADEAFDEQHAAAGGAR